MTSRFKNWLLGILVLIFLIGIFFAGFFTFPKYHPPPVFTSSHTVVYDTASKHIYHIYPWYIEKLVSVAYKDQAWIDSIMKANQIDSTSLSDRYYATYQYNRMVLDFDPVTKDTTLVLKWTDAISQNKAMPVDGFDYKYIRPTYVTNNVDNSVNYAKYLYIGGSIPLYDAKMANLGLFVAFPRGLYGVTYVPATNSINLTGAIRIIKFK